MPENKTALENVVNWLNAGYPEGGGRRGDGTP